MAYAYPPHHPDLPYVGRQHYVLTFCTARKARVFLDGSHVVLVRTHILRAAREVRFQTTAYCFMPDHVHLIVTGCDDRSDAKTFIRLAKQYSGYYFKRENGLSLWQRYGYERVIRDEVELVLTIRYVLANPVRAGIVDHPAKYPHLGSQQYTVAELLLMCEYDSTPSA